ncbi:hypothetical protein F8388_026554 [Cannabis sativa]|uniref:Uncharacterized protein n=1 Tax=Cannabis sativa TaxID=3483 RepID=A0A7J6FV82_CANSA|nr:hypothetical protein F8388_026554 [Cannabis sativa]KAF4374666.1 hypothetical protein G4B88_004918 [Cannabis sativa]
MGFDLRKEETWFFLSGNRGGDDDVEEEEEEEEEAMNLNGEELAGPPGPKVTRLVYFVGAAFICVIGINKWREFQNKPVVLPQDPKLQQQSQK